MISVTLVVYFGLALGVSFLCSLLESALLSTSPAHVEVLVQRGKRSGRMLRGFRERIDRPLIAILATNTVANMFGAAGVGAESARLAEARGVDETLWVGVSSALLTAAILVCSEIIPKTLGAVFWRPLSGLTAYLVAGLMFVTWPVVKALEAVPRLVAGKGGGELVSREEIAALTELARRGGTMPTGEVRVISNLFAMQNLRARDVMTPRVEVFALPRELTVSEAAESHRPIRFSRIPVYEENMDHVVGVALRYQIFESLVDGEGGLPLGRLSRPTHYVPESMSIARLLDEFLSRRAHLFVVVNEYGGTEGIVTLEDVIETLLGVEIVDELDSVADLRELAKQKLEARKRLMHMEE